MSELVDYETQHHACGCSDGAVDNPTIPVQITHTVTTVETVPQHITCYSVPLTAAAPVVELLPLDPLRVRATIMPTSQPVVICHSLTQAQDANNVVATAPSPNGAYLPVGAANITITGTQALWVVLTGSTSSRVGVIVERRAP